MRYKHKLVRDKIPEYIRKRGGRAVFHIASDKEYREALKKKLIEEVREFNKSEEAEEIADIMEVLDAIIEYKGYDRGDIKKQKERKAGERGKFAKRIILDKA